jgi:transcription initiation factor IIF auxiliary subunit
MKKENNYEIGQAYKFEGDDWWSWWIWVNAEEKKLDEIIHVVYTLHPTFNKPVRKITDRKSKFKLETEGWGVFTIYAKIVLRTGQEISLKHELHLEYPDGSNNLP